MQIDARGLELKIPTDTVCRVVYRQCTDPSEAAHGGVDECIEGVKVSGGFQAWQHAQQAYGGPTERSAGVTPLVRETLSAGALGEPC